jgi:hypothetical protein
MAVSPTRRLYELEAPAVWRLINVLAFIEPKQHA